jgi:hypothetical protein
VPRAVPGQEARTRSARQTARRVYNAFGRSRVASGVPLLAKELHRKMIDGRRIRPSKLT